MTNTNTTITTNTSNTISMNESMLDQNDVTVTIDDDTADVDVDDTTYHNTTTKTTTLSSPLPSLPLYHHHRRKLYILSLVQMYQELYHQYIIPYYKDMIWNLTKARRALQSRSNSCISGTASASSSSASSSSGGTATLLNVIHIPSHRTFSAQRRIFDTTTKDRRPRIVFYECDEQDGRMIHVLPPSTPSSTLLIKEETEEENEDYVTDPDPNENPNHMETNGAVVDIPDTITSHTGLRQRRGRPKTEPLTTSVLQQGTDLLLPKASIILLQNETEDAVETTTTDIHTQDPTNRSVQSSSAKLLKPNEFLSLLLLSSGTGGRNNTTDLYLAQQTSQQLLHDMTTLQTWIVQQLQQEIHMPSQE